MTTVSAPGTHLFGPEQGGAVVAWPADESLPSLEHHAAHPGPGSLQRYRWVLNGGSLSPQSKRTKDTSGRATKARGGNRNGKSKGAPERTHGESPLLVVGLGASAGGLQDFEEFFEHLPPRPGMAFVVVSHLHPEHPSELAGILSRTTSLSVAEATHGQEVERDHVYVIPRGVLLTMRQDRLQALETTDPHHRRAVIDLFFRSLAEELEEHAVGIVLSGLGTDGTLGIEAIKAAGGLVMAHTEASARFSSMPRSAAATGLVDHVLAPAEMPEVLIEHLRHLRELEAKPPTYPLEDGREAVLVKILAHLHTRVGHDFSHYKQRTVLRRIRRRMQVLQVESLDDYLSGLRHDPLEAEALFYDLLIGVTQFFREPASWEALAKRVIPELFDGKEGSELLRIWVPGCSTGEEAYSLAILLEEHRQEGGFGTEVQVFATDIDDRAIQVARHGIYPASIAADVGEQRLKRFFQSADDSFRVSAPIREICIFSVHNLTKHPPFSRLDLISCRNLLIYLDNQIQGRLLSLFHFALRRRGYLFLGPSESISTTRELFATVDSKHRIFRARDVQRQALDLPLIPARGGRQAPLVPSLGAGAEPAVQRQAERLLLQEYAPPAVLIDQSHEVLHFLGRTGRYLEPPVGEARLNLLDMARKGLRMVLRTAVHQAGRRGEAVSRRGIRVQTNGDVEVLDLVVRPVATADEKGAFLVTFKPQVVSRGKETGGSAGQEALPEEDPALQHLEEELKATQELLQTSTEELETSNEELRSSNEELLSMNEELQSANEELETSKEELQSVNEELETVNAELRSKVEELYRANGDLRNLFESTQVATLFLDAKLRLRSFTPPARDLFKVIQSDTGRPLTDLAQRFQRPELEEDLRRVMREQETIQDTVRTEHGRPFLMRLVPYLTADEEIDGVVLTFFDITALE
jgi:two-component system, chemotaxis family, CheB/CheR fusion protein